MARLAQFTDTGGERGPGSGRPTCPPDSDAELCLQLRSYFQYRSRNLVPPPSLVEAWDRFYDDYTTRIRAFLGRFRLPEADREDCLQDIWSEIVAHLADLPYDPRRARLSTWLMTVARNRAVDALRRRRRMPTRLAGSAASVMDTDPGPVVACERLWTQARVQDVLTELSLQSPTLSFQVLYQRAIDGRTSAEVADTLGLTPDQVRFRLYRMKQRFRDLFERSTDRDIAGGAGGGAPPA